MVLLMYNLQILVASFTSASINCCMLCQPVNSTENTDIRSSKSESKPRSDDESNANKARSSVHVPLEFNVRATYSPFEEMETHFFSNDR